MIAVIAILFGLFANSYAVHFEGTAAVREGMPLLYKGVEIGTVTEAGVDTALKPFAEVKVKRKFRDLFREGCAVSLDGGRLELVRVDRDRRPLPDGASVAGLAGPMDYIRFGYETVKGKIRDLQLRQDYDRLLEEMDRSWDKGRDRFREEWPKFKQRLRDMRDQVGPELREEFERIEKAWDEKAA